MQRQELLATRETLVARNAELAEVKSRVAELEEIQQQQQKLLSMKDSELAAVQQRLAQATDEPSGESQADGSSLPWVWGGVAVLLLALLAGWLLRRRGNAATASRPPFRPLATAKAATGSSSMADAFAPARGVGSSASAEARTPIGGAPPRADEPRSVAVSDPAHSRDGTPADSAKPATGNRVAADASRPSPGRIDPSPAKAAQSSSGPRSPTWHVDTDAPSPSTDTKAAAAPAADTPAQQERLELARAYLDLGDRDSARQLLDEVAGSGDDAARQQASRMLRELD